MWPDNETTDDLIGFQVHADLIRAVITNPKMLPVTIGVFGDWGGGKTSIMKMLERDLEAENWDKGSKEHSEYQDIAVIYLNPWLFEGYDDAKSAILASVLLQLGEHKRFGPRVRDKILGLLKSVNIMRLVRLGIKHAAIPAAVAFATAGSDAVIPAVLASAGLSALIAQPDNKQSDEKAEKPKEPIPVGVDWSELLKKDASPPQPLDVRTFRQRFESMLADSKIRTLIVLIDDLDRCTPDRIIENLEAIKLFLSVDRTAFVIGADPRLVEHAIRSRYAEPATAGRNLEETERLVVDYLEKLIQVPYRLPRLSASEIETYMVLLFCERHLSSSDLRECRSSCNELRTKNRYSTFGAAQVRAALKGAEPSPEMAKALAFIAWTAPLIADGLKGNPRQVKRFLNAFLLRKELAVVAKLAHIQDDVLVKLMILEYTHQDLFRQLFGWQAEQSGFPKQLRALEEAKDDLELYEESAKKADPKWATPSAHRWISLVPLLSKVDLRDYFWIARDRLSSTFVGLSFVPPVVRAALEDLMSSGRPKQKAAIGTVKSFNDEERSLLIGLVGQHVTRQPAEMRGYAVLRELTDEGVVGAAEQLAKVLLEVPSASIPPSVGMDVVGLSQSKAHLGGILRPAIERLAASGGKVAAAVQEAQKPKR